MEREALTNEYLRKKFKSQFDLVNYAIKRAEYSVKSGHEPHVKIDSQNLAAKILAEISSEKTEMEIPSLDMATLHPVKYVAEVQIEIEEDEDEEDLKSKGKNKKKAAIK